MKRLVLSSRDIQKRYAASAMDRLKSMLGISFYSNVSISSTEFGKCNFVLSDRYHRLDQNSEYYQDLKKIGAKYITVRYGSIYFYYDMTRLKEEASAEQAQYDAQYSQQLEDFDISKYKPTDAIIKKIMDYRAKGSKVNVKAIKDKDKLFTYLYTAKLIGWSELIHDIRQVAGFDYEDEVSSILHNVKTDPQYEDTRNSDDISLGLNDSKGLLSFEMYRPGGKVSCWLPKSILQFFIDNDIPVHFGKRTSGAQYDHNGAQWSEIEHLTLFPDSDAPIKYDIVVHTNERADGSIPNTYTGNGTPERVSAKQIIEDLKRTITLKD